MHSIPWETLDVRMNGDFTVKPSRLRGSCKNRRRRRLLRILGNNIIQEEEEEEEEEPKVAKPDMGTP